MKVAHKGWLMVFIPIVVSLALCAALMYFVHQSEVASKDNERNLAIEVGLTHLSQLTLDATSAMMTYAFTKQDVYQEKYVKVHADAEKTFSALSELIDEPAQVKRLKLTHTAQSRLFKILDELRTPGQFDDMKDLVAINGVREQMQGLTREIDEKLAEIKKEQEKKNGIARLDPEDAKNSLRNSVYIAAIASVLSGIALAMVFMLTVSRRMATVIDNAARIKVKQALHPPLSGDDEIAELDKIFRLNIEILDEKALKEQLLMFNSSDVICLLDEAGNFKKINRAVQKNWGYHPDQIVGQKITDFVFSGDVDKTANAFKQNVSSPSGASLETRIKTDEGEKVRTVWAMYWVPSEKAHFCIVRNEGSGEID